MSKYNYSIVEFRETDTAKICLCSDDIVRVLYKKNADITLEKNRENIRNYTELIKGRRLAFLFDHEGFGINFTSEARDDARANEKDFPCICIAVVVTILAYKILAEFYMKFHKPNIPYKIFRSRDQAAEWCYEMITKENIEKSINARN